MAASGWSRVVIGVGLHDLHLVVEAAVRAFREEVAGIDLFDGLEPVALHAFFQVFAEAEQQRQRQEDDLDALDVGPVVVAEIIPEQAAQQERIETPAAGDGQRPQQEQQQQQEPLDAEAGIAPQDEVMGGQLEVADGQGGGEQEKKEQPREHQHAAASR